MPIITTCSACSRKVQVPEELLGKMVQCPICASQFTATDGAIPTVRPVAPVPPPEDIQRGLPRRPPAEDPRGIDEAGPPRRPSAGDSWDDDYDRDRPPSRRRYDRDDYAPLRRRGPGLEGLSHEYAIDVGEWFNYAKEHYSAAFGPMIGFMVILILISMVEAIPILGALIALVMLFINPALHAGFAIVSLAQLRGMPWTFGDFFAGFKWYGALLANFWLNVAINLACLMPGLIALAIAAVMVEVTRAEAFFVIAVLGGMFSAVLLVFFTVRLNCFAVQLIVDRDCGPVEAMQGCWRLSQGHFWGLFGVGLLIMLIVLAGVLACFVGVLFAAPFAILTWNAGYLAITNRAALRQGVPPRLGHEFDEFRDRR